jgi:dethiobiotin synthetase
MMAAKGSYFISGIGTGIGKTVISAILVEALKADYWKPVQAGGLDATDSMEVQSLVSNSNSVFHPEVYRLPYPVSPHASAARAGIEIEPNRFQLPTTNNRLIVEGAGGLLVPLNSKLLLIDLIELLGLPVVLVSRHYLGSINHTLLSAEALKNRQISVRGILFNGAENRESESVIQEITGLEVLGRVEETEQVDREFILNQSKQFNWL